MPKGAPPMCSFLEVAPNSDFPIQNLPYGVFSTPENPQRRVGVAIGEFVLDLAELEAAGLTPTRKTRVFNSPALNDFIALGRSAWTTTRARLTELLSHVSATLRDDAALRRRALHPISSAVLHLPFKVEGFTDFYSSREHASNVGALFRGPGHALAANWLHIPIGYNGRASTVVVSGTPVQRPLGQIKPPDRETPVFGPTAKLDIELEMGVVVGRDTALGETLSVEAAQEAIFGFVLLNDWSARDIQQSEYVPLGPFQSKAFATSISSWVVTADALAPFLVEGPEQDPAPLPYLRQRGAHNYDLCLEAELTPKGADRATVISRTNFRAMYWSSAQQLAHHTSSGCAMRVGDLLGSGTISGPGEDQVGSLLERTLNGARPLALATGGTRCFLEDGDRVTLRGWRQGPDYRIGFGEVSGEITPARRPPD